MLNILAIFFNSSSITRNWVKSADMQLYGSNGDWEWDYNEFENEVRMLSENEVNVKWEWGEKDDPKIRIGTELE